MTVYSFARKYQGMSLKIGQQRKEKFIRWIKRIGLWGFIFFLIKGLCWLALGYWLMK